MKIKKLIKILQELDGEKEIYLFNYDRQEDEEMCIEKRKDGNYRIY